MSRALKRFYLGNIIATGGTKRWRRLTTQFIFTLGTVTLTAEDGMTWADWLASSYNADLTEQRFIVDSTTYNAILVETVSGSYVVVADADGNIVQTTDTIVSGHVYITITVTPDESIIGTWLLNSYITEEGIDKSYQEKEVVGYVCIQGVRYDFNRMTIWTTKYGNPKSMVIYLFNNPKTMSVGYYSNGESGDIEMKKEGIDTTYVALTLTADEFVEARTITFTGGEYATHKPFITWFKANATKQ